MPTTAMLRCPVHCCCCCLFLFGIFSRLGKKMAGRFSLQSPSQAMHAPSSVSFFGLHLRRRRRPTRPQTLQHFNDVPPTVIEVHSSPPFRVIKPYFPVQPSWICCCRSPCRWKLRRRCHHTSWNSSERWILHLTVSFAPQHALHFLTTCLCYEIDHNKVHSYCYLFRFPSLSFRALSIPNHISSHSPKNNWQHSICAPDQHENSSDKSNLNVY